MQLSEKLHILKRKKKKGNENHAEGQLEDFCSKQDFKM